MLTIRLEWLSRFCVGRTRIDRNELAFRPSQCRQFSTEYTTGIDAECIIEPLGSRDGSVAVDDRSLASVVCGPVVANRQSKLIGLTGCLAVECEFTDSARTSPLHRFLHPRMSDHQFAAIQYVMTDELIEELLDRLPELVRLPSELLERFRKAMFDLNVLTRKGSHQLVVMISGDTDGVSRCNQIHREAEDCRCLGTSVDEISEKDELPWNSILKRRLDIACSLGFTRDRSDSPVELLEEFDKFVVTAMHIADDIERPMFMLEVIPEPLSYQRRVGTFLRCSQGEDMSKPFAEQSSKFSLHGSALIANHMRTKIAIGSRGVSIVTDFLGGIDDDCNGQTVKFASELYQGLTVLGPDVGRIDDGQQSACEAFAGQIVKDFKCVARRFLIILIVRDPTSERVR